MGFLINFILYDALFSSFEIRALEEKYFDAVDLIETAFNKLADNAVSRNVYFLNYVFVRAFINL